MYSKIKLLFYCLLFSIPYLAAQDFTEKERNSGYTIQDSNLVFIFDVELYGVLPINVIVTGSFRNWSQEMTDQKWILEPMSNDSSLWTLTIDNSDLGVIKPASPFKFRIDNGRWLDPPQSADNVKGGNLIFMSEYKVPKLKVELLKNNSMWLYSEGLEVSLDPSDYPIKKMGW